MCDGPPKKKIKKNRFGVKFGTKYFGILYLI